MKKVLLLEDDKFLVRVFLMKLNKLGIEAVFLENGSGAKDLLVDNQFGVVVLDLVMPGYDGYKVLSDIRSDSRTNSLPVIVVTASNSDEDKKKCLEQQVKEYFVKGDVAFPTIVQTIQKYI